MSREGSEARLVALRQAELQADAVRELQIEVENRNRERHVAIKGSLQEKHAQDRIDRLNNVILRLGGELKHR